MFEKRLTDKKYMLKDKVNESIGGSFRFRFSISNLFESFFP